MKKYAIFTFVFSIIFILLSCSKERKIQRHLEGKWNIVECNLDGVGRLISNEHFTEIIFEFKEGKTFNNTWHWDYEDIDSLETIDTGGIWSVDNEELILNHTETESALFELAGDNNPNSRLEYYDILELTKESSFELEGILNGKSVQIVGEYID